MDWRFLLPRARAARVVCFAGGVLPEAMAEVADRIWVLGELPDAGSCDLTVARNPDHRTLRAAARALEHGGACYTEWRRWPWHTAAGVRRRLEHAGFDHVACYATWPNLDVGSPAIWVSLDSSGAVADFLARLPRARSRHGRARQWLRRVLWRAAPRLRMAPLICAVARTPAAAHGVVLPRAAAGRTSPAPASACQDALFEMIRSNWSSWGLGQPPDHLGWTLLTGGRRSINKVVALAFAGRDPTPRLAVKLARVPESHVPLRNEAHTLEAVRRLHPDGMPGVPRLLFCRTDAGVLALGETALTGRPLAMVMRAENAMALATHAADWLPGLLVSRGRRPLDERRHRIVDPAVATFAASFGTVLDPGMLREASDALTTLGALPEVLEQRDFAPWNLLVTRDGELVVLDWESSEVHGLPLLDLVYFVSHFAFYVEHAADLARRREAYRATLDPSTRVGEIAQECVTRYMECLQLPAAALWPLRLLTWMLHARSEYRQFAADGGREPGPEALRRSLFLALWEEEVRRGPAS